MTLPPNLVDYRPIIERPVIKRRNETRFALWIPPDVDHYEYLPENNVVRKRCHATTSGAKILIWEIPA